MANYARVDNEQVRARVAEKHRKLSERVDALHAKRHLDPSESQRLQSLKKEKLAMKDTMAILNS